MASTETREYRMAFCRVPDGEVRSPADDPVIYQQQPVGPEGLRVRVDSSHNRLDRHSSVAGNHLAAIDPIMRAAHGRRLPEGLRIVPPAADGDDREQLQERLQTERTGP